MLQPPAVQLRQFQVSSQLADLLFLPFFLPSFRSFSLLPFTFFHLIFFLTRYLHSHHFFHHQNHSIHPFPYLVAPLLHYLTTLTSSLHPFFFHPLFFHSRFLPSFLSHVNESTFQPSTCFLIFSSVSRVSQARANERGECNVCNLSPSLLSSFFRSFFKKGFNIK